MHKEVLNEKTKKTISKLTEYKILENFYLAGGTALALQFGHRKSIDLYWFSQKGLNNQEIKKGFYEIGDFGVEHEAKNTLHLNSEGVSLSFLYYPYDLLFDLIEWEGAKLADYRDIACMKLEAISSRGSKKDFIDLFFILQEHNFDEVFSWFENKYSKIKYNWIHIFKSLAYFEEAEKEPMPIMFKKADWEEIKKFFSELARNQQNK